MLFRRCTVNGIDYNHLPSEWEEEYSRSNLPTPPLQTNAKLLEDMSAGSNQMQQFTIQAQRIQEFFLVLSICNTVVVSATPHRDLMNASGMIEPQEELTIVKPVDSTANNNEASHSRGKKLNEKYLAT